MVKLDLEQQNRARVAITTLELTGQWFPLRELFGGAAGTVAWRDVWCGALAQRGKLEIGGGLYSIILSISARSRGNLVFNWFF